MGLNKLSYAISGVVMAAISLSAKAAVIVTGVAFPDENHLAQIYSDTDTDPLIAFAPKPGMSQRIKIDVFAGSIASANAHVPYYVSHDQIINFDGQIVNASGDFPGEDSCGYDGFGVACNGGVTSPKLQILGKSAKTAIFQWSLPKNDPLCDPTAVGCEAFYNWAGYGWLDLTVSSTRPVDYRVSVTDFPSGAGAVPEPASWAMMVAGFGAVGSLSRRPKRLMRQDALA